MRLPKVLEFPAVILATGVLTFTGVSALQASVNPPLHERVQKAAAETGGETGYGSGDPGAASATGDLRSALSPEAVQPPELLAAIEVTSLETAHGADPALAVTGESPSGESTAIEVAPTLAEEIAQAAPAVHAAAGVAAPPAAAGQSNAAVKPAAPVPAAPQQAATPAKSAAPTPVSGMDYVWDQVFGNGNYAKPAAPAKNAAPPAGSKSQGAQNAAVCPPGQAKKGNC